MSQKTETPLSGKGISFDTGDRLFWEMFNRIQTGIILIDPDTHVIVDANEIAEQILGISKSNLVNRRCHEYICPAKAGACPVTAQNTPIANEEKIFINHKGEMVAVLKTVARVKISAKEYLVESFVDISKQKKAEEHKNALIGFMNESMLRIRRPLELTQMNMQLIADHVKSGEFEPEEIRMELQIQANNIGQMIKNLDELVLMVADERGQDISREFREFLIGK